MTNQVLFLNLPFSVSGLELSKFCSSVVVPRAAEAFVDAVTSRSKGVGVATFDSVLDAARVAQELNGQQLKGSTIKIELATPELLTKLGLV